MLDDVRRARMSPVFDQVVGNPQSEVQSFAVRELRVAVGATEKKQCIDDLTEQRCLGQSRPEHAPIFVLTTVLPQRDLNLTDENGQGRSQLM
jgi:hypothetical protein